MTFCILAKKDLSWRKGKNPLPKTFSHSQDMSLFVGGPTLRLTAGRAFRCPFLENQLAGLRALFLSDGLYVGFDEAVLLWISYLERCKQMQGLCLGFGSISLFVSFQMKSNSNRRPKTVCCGLCLIAIFRFSENRGVGKVPSVCPASRSDLDAGLCYPKCRSGYSGIGKEWFLVPSMPQFGHEPELFIQNLRQHTLTVYIPDQRFGVFSSFFFSKGIMSVLNLSTVLFPKERSTCGATGNSWQHTGTEGRSSVFPPSPCVVIMSMEWSFKAHSESKLSTLA